MLDIDVHCSVFRAGAAAADPGSDRGHRGHDAGEQWQQGKWAAKVLTFTAKLVP